MKNRLRLIYNPYAGRRKLLGKLDEVIEIFQNGGYEVCIHRTTSPQDIQQTAALSSDVDCLVIAGGDGSIHHTVNGLLKLPAEQRPALGILPVGTANDLAYGLRIPRNILGACEVIVRHKLFKMDVGMVNNQYFVNVASAGFLTDVSPRVDVRVKNSLGQLAYYLKGLETLPEFRPFSVEFEVGGEKRKEEILLLLVVNGHSVGGLRQLFPAASLSDGKLDVMMVPRSGWPETFLFLIRFLRGETGSDGKVIQFQTDHLIIQPDRKLSSDLDGEWGPESAWDIRMGPKIDVIC